MKKSLLFLFGSLWLLAACAPRAPELVLGDAWNYTLRAADLPAGWTFSAQSVLTAEDVARALTPVTDTVTTTVNSPSLAKVTQLYTARYTPPTASEYSEFTLQILLYPSAADARSSLSAEDPGAGWTKVEAPAVGEQSQVWRYQEWLTDTSQGLYRVDFRYWNAVGSVTMFGSALALPGPAEPLEYAQKVVEYFKTGADPEGLRQLRAAGRPDVRAQLLTQRQLAALDPAFGERWVVSDQYFGAWTLNADFGGEASATLDRLGRVSGYQLYLVKPVEPKEYGGVSGAALFQQVSVYREASAAPNGLKALVGLAGAPELADPPAVGEGRRAWSRVAEIADGSSIAVTEISFYVGQSVATVQLQSAPLPKTADPAVKLSENLALAAAFAQQLAANLAGQ